MGDLSWISCYEGLYFFLTSSKYIWVKLRWPWGNISLWQGFAGNQEGNFTIRLLQHCSAKRVLWLAVCSEQLSSSNYKLYGNTANLFCSTLQRLGKVSLTFILKRKKGVKEDFVDEWFFRMNFPNSLIIHKENTKEMWVFGNQMKNCSFLHPSFLFLKSFCLKSNIEHSTQCFVTRWNNL